MSANNWTQCPRCELTNLAKADEKDKIASESYGKAPPEEFDNLREDAKSFRKAITSDDNFCSTLREDWSLGICRGQFDVIYKASCATCGFKFVYNHEEQVK